MGVTALNVVKVNVLRWNERLRNIQESHGLFLVRFNNNKPRKNREDDDSGGDCCVSVFETQNLSAPDSTEWVVSKAMQDSLEFLSDQEATTRTRKRLTAAISAYLFRYFRLNHDGDQEQKPRIVIVVELPLSIMTKKCAQIDHVGKDRRLQKNRHPEAKSSLRFLCVSGRFRDQEVKEIRGILLTLLSEPIVLWVRPVVTYKPTGLFQVEELLNGNYQPQDNYSAC